MRCLSHTCPHSAAFCIALRQAFLRHVVTLARTQTLGRALRPETLALVHAHRRGAQIGAVALHLRPLQRRILQHLWRPGGALASRACAEWHALTSTPDGDAPAA